MTVGTVVPNAGKRRAIAIFLAAGAERSITAAPSKAIAVDTIFGGETGRREGAVAALVNETGAFVAIAVVAAAIAHKPLGTDSVVAAPPVTVVVLVAHVSRITGGAGPEDTARGNAVLMSAADRSGTTVGAHRLKAASAKTIEPGRT